MTADRPFTVVQCLACGHVATWRRQDDEPPLVRLTKRLVCSVCGSRAVKAERAASKRGEPKPKRQ